MDYLRDSPVFIAGQPLSGTSQLASIFDAHPELVTYPEETNFFRRYLPKATGKSQIEKLILSDQYLTHIFEWNQTNPPAHQARFLDRDYLHISVSRVRQAVKQLVTNQFRHDGDMLSAVILAYGQVTGQITPSTEHWVDKTRYNEFYADKIFTWWPAALMVHIVRDPRDIFASYRRRHANWAPDAYALNWVRSTQAGLDNLARYGKEHYWLLSYEDLVNTPEEELSQLFQFLRITDDPSLRRLTRDVRSVTGSLAPEDRVSPAVTPMDRWREALSREDVIALELVAAPVMRRVGYTLSGQMSSLGKQDRVRLILRLLALSLEAKSAQDHLFIRAGMAVITDPSRIDKIEVPPATAAQSRWRLLLAGQNISRLLIALFKEIFSK